MTVHRRCHHTETMIGELMRTIRKRLSRDYDKRLCSESLLSILRPERVRYFATTAGCVGSYSFKTGFNSLTASCPVSQVYALVGAKTAETFQSKGDDRTAMPAWRRELRPSPRGPEARRGWRVREKARDHSIHQVR